MKSKIQRKLHIAVVLLLSVSLFVSSVVPVSAAGSVDNGWYPMHRMPAISDDPVTGAEGDWYLMPNLPLVLEPSTPSTIQMIYDTSLTYDQFYNLLISNEVDYGTKLCPERSAYDMQNMQYRSVSGVVPSEPVRNYFSKPRPAFITAFYDVGLSLVDRFAGSPLSVPYNLGALFAAWYDIYSTDGDPTTLLDRFVALRTLGVSGLISLGKSTIQYDSTVYSFFQDTYRYLYFQCASTEYLSSNYYWTFTPTSRQKNLDNIRGKDGYWSAWVEDSSTHLLVERFRYYLNTSTGNNLEKDGTAGGVTTEKPYYTEAGDPHDDIVTDAEVYAVYTGETSSYSYIDYHDNQIYDIAGDQFINNGSLWYNQDNREYTYVTENYYITVNNYYTYNYVNYYMPGSDVPFSTYAVYYQLPDGRNSATLTADDIFGLNIDFDVIPYDQASEDTRMLALYHLDGTFDNEAITYSYQGGAVDQWQFDFNPVSNYLPLSVGQSSGNGLTLAVSDGYLHLTGTCSSQAVSSSPSVSSVSLPAGTYYFYAFGPSSGFGLYGFNISYSGFSQTVGSSYTLTLSSPQVVTVSVIGITGRSYDLTFRFQISSAFTTVYVPFGSGVRFKSSDFTVFNNSLTYNYVNNPTPTTLTGADPVWTAPYDGYYRFTFKSSGSAANIGYGNTSYARMIWSLNGSPFFGTVLDARTSSTQVGNYIAGTFTNNLGGALTVHTFSSYLSAGDELQFSAAYQPDSSGSSAAANVTVQDVMIYGYGDTNSQATLGNFSEFEFTNGASTQFVTTGDENFAGSLYLDGLGHDFQISLPENPNASYGDWTVTFRYYQEQSTNTGLSYVSFGADSYAGNVAFASLIFDGAQFKYILFDGNGSMSQAYGSGSDITIPYGTWNTITLCRSGGQLLFFLNGVQVANVRQGTQSLTPDGNIYFHFAADSNVHYIDEIMVASYAMYTVNHTPRLIPWDSNSVYVLPYAVNKNSIAVKTPFAISGYRIGGVRPTFPDKGMVYAYIDNNYITSIQVYNGSAWIDCGGAVFFNGHWYSIENFRFGTVSEQYDADPAVSEQGSKEGSTSILDLINNIQDTLGDILAEIKEITVNVKNNTINIVSGVLINAQAFIKASASFVVKGLGNLVTGFSSLLTMISTALVAGWYTLTTPLTGLVTAVWSALPVFLKTFVVGSFAVVICGGVVHFVNR